VEGERVSEQAHGLMAGTMEDTTLKVADAGDAEAGSLSQLILRQASSDAVALDQQTERCDGRWFHVTSLQGHPCAARVPLREMALPYVVSARDLAIL
jgi:hypothetical protein